MRERERDEFREPAATRQRIGGNPEPSRRYTAGRCRDYLRATAPFITGSSVPHPTRALQNAGG